MDRQADSDRVKTMERKGYIKLGSGKVPASFWQRSLPKDPKGLMLDALLKERRESR